MDDRVVLEEAQVASAGRAVLEGRVGRATVLAAGDLPVAGQTDSARVDQADLVQAN